MIEVKYAGNALWDRIERAVEKVKDRLRRVTQALNAADIPYAVIGGNAVQHWVAQVDESVVRNTQDVDIILNHSDLPRAIPALQAAGFIYQHSAGITMFLDGPEAKAHDAVNVIFAGTKVREEYTETVPLLDAIEWIQKTRTLPLEHLVRIKLTSFRRKDQVHILDMISVGLIDQSWPAKYPAQLRNRLQQLLDDPDGQASFPHSTFGLNRQHGSPLRVNLNACPALHLLSPDHDNYLTSKPSPPAFIRVHSGASRFSAGPPSEVGE